MPSVFITDKAVQGLRAEGRRLEVRDAKVPGLVLRITENGRKTWSCQFRRKGEKKTQRQTLGTYPAMGVARAREKATGVLRALQDGKDPIAEEKARVRQASIESLTFADLVDDYLGRRRGVVSMPEVERELRKDVLPKLGTKNPAKITAADIDELVQLVAARGAASMARRIVVHIKALYNFVLFDAPALAERYAITSNPAQMLGRRRHGSPGALAPPKARQRVLGEEEIAAWWRALEASSISPDKRLALKLVLVTGQRPGEVRCCRADGLRLDGKEPFWLLQEEETKNRRRHIVPLSTLAVDLFREALELAGDATQVFRDPRRPNEPLPSVALPTAQGNLFRLHLSDLEPATVHDLRRSAATGMRRRGIAPHVVSAILNHTRQDITGKVYDHYDGLAERRDALQAWAVHLRTIVGRKSAETAARELGDGVTKNARAF